jgi:16S rRNA (guanine(966)-N(2))-methyltransferase RsmD
MRVVGGTAKGRTLLPVPGDTTRPILDRVKTSLFDIIRPNLEGIRMLDLFGGSGAVGIEALSQGASHCTFLDLSKKATETIKENLKTCQLESQAEVRTTDAFAYLRNTKKSFDLIYVAPPQYENLWVEAMHHIAERPDLVTGNGQVIVQIDPKEHETLLLNALTIEQERRYGNTLLLFYQKNSAS